MNNKTKMLLLLPPVLIILCILAANSLPFDQSFSESESQFLDFISSDLKISKQKIVKIAGNIKGPFDFTRSSAQIPDDKVAEIDYNEHSLSLTVVTDDARMAIINGELVTEGDTLPGMKILRIEAERVLTNNKTAEWLYLEKTK